MCSLEENWAADSLSVRTAEVTSSSRHAVAYTSFSSHLLWSHLNTEVVRELAPRLKMHN